MNRYIGVFDSGIGGITVLEQLKKVLPHESFIYYGDSKNNPYGEKEYDELYEIVRKIVDYLISRDVKLIVIACNTVTTRYMKKLRDDYKSMIFVGIVPAIKVACDNNFKNTLVMATPATISSERTHELIVNNKSASQNITLLSCDGLANVIESKDEVAINDKLTDIFKEYKDIEFDSIVLGCTHYPLVSKNINTFFPDAVLLDGSYGVSMEVKRQLIVHDLLNKSANQEVIIYNSMDENSI